MQSPIKTVTIVCLYFVVGNLPWMEMVKKRKEKRMLNKCNGNEKVSLFRKHYLSFVLQFKIN